MAESILFICKQCNHSIQAWSDGNPYYFDKNFNKQYAYHPDHEKLDRCIGNDSPHICLSCGAEIMIDSRKPVSVCPKCKHTELADTFKLEGLRCPYCKKGFFKKDPNHYCIS